MPINCNAIHRLCFAYTGHSSEGAHNGNGNSRIFKFSVGGGPLDGVKLSDGARPYAHWPALTHEWSKAGDALTFQNREWRYNPEFFWGDTKLYYPPPICGGCVDAYYPRIGLEGGLTGYQDGSNSYDKDIEDDFNNFGSSPCSFYGGEFFELGYLGIQSPYQYQKVCGWDPMKKKKGKTPWRADNYGKTWCQPDDLGAYEQVSVYAPCSVLGCRGLARMTPMRFHKDDEKDPNKVKKYNFVWAVTALCLPVDGKLVVAIRKRWYDMILYRLMYTVGYWQYPMKYEKKIGCLTNDSKVDGPDDMIARPFFKK